MLKDNTLELHGLIGGNLKSQDSIKRFKIVGNGDVSSSSYKEDIKNTGATSDNYIFFKMGDYLYKLSINPNNSESLGTITMLNRLSYQKFMAIKSIPNGFGVMYWKDSGICVFELYDKNCLKIGSYEKSMPLSSANANQCGIIGNWTNGNVTFITEWNSGNQRVITLSSNGSLLYERNPADYYSCPNVKNGGVADGDYIIAPDIYFSQIIKYNVPTGQRVYSKSLGTVTDKIVIDTKYDCMFSAQVGTMYKTSDFTQYNDFLCSKFNIEHINLYNTTFSPKPGGSQIWMSANGEGYEMYFAKEHGKKYINIRFLSELQQVNGPTTPLYPFCSPSAKTLVLFNNSNTKFTIYNR
ncbi:hypothetical protein FDB84_12260 [Clostridium sporogenes]|nr:hypothetical protein [Clostridium sporogenes]